MTIIKTKYLNPTNTKGARIKAEANGLAVTVSYDYALSGCAVHFAAVKALIKKHRLDWNLDGMRWGADDKGYYFAFDASIV